MSVHLNAVTVLIEIRAISGREREARDALVHAIKTSMKPGLRSSREFEAADDPGVFFAVQEWESIEAFHAHMADVAEVKEEATSMLRESPKVVVLQAI